MERMRPLPLAIVLGVFSISACDRAMQSQSAGVAVSAADSVLLLAVADSIEALPSRFETAVAAGQTPDRSKMAAEAWSALSLHIREVEGRSSESAEREWLIGQIFASAYHVDLHDSTFERAELHLRRAMKLDSLSAAPRLALAQMYVNANPTLAPTAEQLLRGTHVRPRTPESLAVHEGLAFALYYQGQVQSAGTEAALALAEGSKNGAMGMMAARSSLK
jgi:hypothetical protein